MYFRDSITSKQLVKTFGGSIRDYAYSIIQTKDERYVVAGYTFSFDNVGKAWTDMYIVKFK